MSSGFFRTCVVAGSCFLLSCNGVRIDRGPFPIEPDVELMAGKMAYLDGLEKIPAGDSVPNVVLILVDDLGKYDISVYADSGVHTPVLEQLAMNGVTFSSAYSTSSVCSPSRAGMLTGRYQHRFGLERQLMNRYPRGKFEYWFVDHFINTAPMRLVQPGSAPTKEEIEKQGIPASELLLSEILERRGYETGIFGKWHLGHNEPFIPNHRGFGEQYGFYEAFSLYDSENDPGIVNFKHDYYANKHIWRQGRKGASAIRVNDTIVDEDEYLTFSIASRACEFIDRNREVPFFLYVPFSAPHTPFQAPREYCEQFSNVGDKNKQVYYGMISALDHAVGEIIERLKTDGLYENTLIIFASDNGGADYTGATDNGILKSGKFSQFEGGINVPMIAVWKGVIPQNNKFDQPVSLMDVFTTVLSATGCDIPGDRVMDGVDLLPCLREERAAPPHGALFWRTDYNKAVREGAYKLVWNMRDHQEFLYDLEHDPLESVDLSGEFPDLTEALKKEILEWEKQMIPPLWPGVMEFRIEVDDQVTWWAI